MNLEEKTVAELKEIAIEQGVDFSGCKNPSKPNKSELLSLIELPEEKEEDGSLPEVDAPELDGEKVSEPVKAKTNDSKPTDRQTLAYLNAQVKVIVHDNYVGEKLDLESDDHMFSVSVGNRKIPSRTEFIRTATHEPQGITRVALSRLKSIMMPAHMQRGKKKVDARMVPRFTIQEIPEGYSEQEIEEMKKNKSISDAQAV